MVRFRTKEEKLEDQLFREVQGKSTCPYIKRNCEGAYCGKDLKEGEKVSRSHRIVCDISSLQLWCLDANKYDKCIQYKGDSFQV